MLHAEFTFVFFHRGRLLWSSFFFWGQGRHGSFASEDEGLSRAPFAVSRTSRVISARAVEDDHAARTWSRWKADRGRETHHVLYGVICSHLALEQRLEVLMRVPHPAYASVRFRVFEAQSLPLIFFRGKFGSVWYHGATTLADVVGRVTASDRNR